MITTLIDRNGTFHAVHIHGTGTTRADQPVIWINGDLYVVNHLEED